MTDVVSDARLEELFALPHNAIHLAYPRDPFRSATAFETWKSTGILHQDPIPGIYILFQRFTLYGITCPFIRKGFFCMVRMLDENGISSQVIPHEDTLPASVQQRTEALRILPVNAAPTHGLYEDADHILEGIMDGYMQEPLMEFIDDQGVMNSVGKIHDPRDIRIFLEMLEHRNIYLADGHHRFASSLAWARTFQHEDGWHAGHPANHHLMYLSNLRGDDLRVLPIHRVYRAPYPLDPQEMVGRLAKYFVIKDVTQSRTPVYRQIEGRKRVFAFGIRKRQYIAALHAHLDPVRDIQLQLPEAVKRLDYTQLHYFLFDKILGIPYKDQGRSSMIRYVKEYSNAIRTAPEDPTAMAIITNGLDIGEMLEVCASGSLMPQKSTYFYPKLNAGTHIATLEHETFPAGNYPGLPFAKA